LTNINDLKEYFYITNYKLSKNSAFNNWFTYTRIRIQILETKLRMISDFSWKNVDPNILTLNALECLNDNIISIKGHFNETKRDNKTHFQQELKPITVK